MVNFYEILGISHLSSEYEILQALSYYVKTNYCDDNVRRLVLTVLMTKENKQSYDSRLVRKYPYLNTEPYRNPSFLQPRDIQNHIGNLIEYIKDIRKQKNKLEKEVYFLLHEKKALEKLPLEKVFGARNTKFKNGLEKSICLMVANIYKKHGILPEHTNYAPLKTFSRIDNIPYSGEIIKFKTDGKLKYICTDTPESEFKNLGCEVVTAAKNDGYKNRVIINTPDDLKCINVMEREILERIKISLVNIKNYMKYNQNY